LSSPPFPLYSRGKTTIRLGLPAKVYLQDELSPVNKVVPSDGPSEGSLWIPLFTHEVK